MGHNPRPGASSYLFIRGLTTPAKEKDTLANPRPGTSSYLLIRGLSTPAKEKDTCVHAEGMYARREAPSFTYSITA